MQFKSTIMASALMLAIAPLPALADSGFYIGASAGGATFEADIDEPSIPSLPSSIDEDDTAFKVFGGYRFDLPLIDIGIEAGYANFGEPDIDVLGETLAIETTGINAWGIAALEVGPIDVFGKLGLVAWDAEATFLGQDLSDDGSDIGYGIGAAFGLGPVQIRGEYEIYDLDGADLSMLSVGIAYLF